MLSVVCCESEIDMGSSVLSSEASRVDPLGMVFGQFPWRPRGRDCLLHPLTQNTYRTVLVISCHLPNLEKPDRIHEPERIIYPLVN